MIAKTVCRFSGLAEKFPQAEACASGSPRLVGNPGALTGRSTLEGVIVVQSVILIVRGDVLTKQGHKDTLSDLVVLSLLMPCAYGCRPSQSKQAVWGCDHQDVSRWGLYERLYTVRLCEEKP